MLKISILKDVIRTLKKLLTETCICKSEWSTTIKCNGKKSIFKMYQTQAINSTTWSRPLPIQLVINPRQFKVLIGRLLFKYCKILQRNELQDRPWTSVMNANIQWTLSHRFIKYFFSFHLLFILLSVMHRTSDYLDQLSETPRYCRPIVIIFVFQ